MKDGFRKTWPYLLVVATVLVANYLFIQMISTTVYYNSVDACTRGNETVRNPLNNFFVTFALDESNETDDPEVADAAKGAAVALEPIECLIVVDKPEGAKDYVAPEDR